MKRKGFSVLFALVLVLSLSLVTAVPATANSTPVIDGVISSGEWDSYYLGTSVTTWQGGMCVDVYGFADETYLYAAYVADMNQPGWGVAAGLCISANLDYQTPQSASWPDQGYTHISVYGDGFAQTDGSDWNWPDGWGNTNPSVFTSRGIEYYVGEPCYGSPHPNTAEVKIPLSLLTYAGADNQIALGGQYWQYDWATPFLVALPDTTPPIVSNVLADPNPAAVGSQVTLTATIDDTNTGGSNIASAEYSLEDGVTWSPMDASDGNFDEVSEDVTVTFTAPTTAGIYRLCVRGTDEHDNTGDPKCVMIVVYDPEGGFVTGGGWIDSPSGAYMPSDSSVVTEANVGVDWFPNDTRNNGYVDFVNGPETPPLGVGSLEMGTTDGTDKAQLFNYDHVGTSLADIDSITYATYRDSSSTNPLAQYPAINIEVDYAGDGSSYTTLVWEPIYAYGQSNLAVDTWQTWDTMAASQTTWQGGWWSTKDIPGVCAFNCFVDWDTIVTNNPNAKILYGFGVNIGSGWNGLFSGAVDALALTVNGETTTYDFEPVAPPTGKASFGFVSKYKKGASVPEGNTEFVFRAADFNFHSSSYDWLVVTGSDYARFKGTGTINGAGDYKFMLWAGDGTGTDGADTFRIKIWEEGESGNENVIYDNGMGQAIGGGSIVVHTK